MCWKVMFYAQENLRTTVVSASYLLPNIFEKFFPKLLLQLNTAIFVSAVLLFWKQ